MIKRPLPTLAVVLTSAAVLLTGCGGAGRQQNNQPAQAGGNPDTAALYKPGIYEEKAGGQPKKGGTLTLGEYVETRNLDPAKGIATGWSGGTAMVAIYDQLMRWDARADKFVPRLAEKVEPNADHTTWTVTIRPGAQFSDGSPVTADAVVASVNRFVAAKPFDMGVIGPHWKGVRATGPSTVEFQLTHSWVSFDAMLGGGMGMIVAPSATAGGGEFKPIGAGAFTLERFAPAEEMVLKANPKYWDGAPYLEKLRLVWLGTDQTRVDSLASKSTDAAQVRTADLVADLRRKNQPGLMEVQSMGNVLMLNQAPGRGAQNPKVRQAIQLTVDPVQLYQRAYKGAGLPDKKLFPSVSRWHNDLPAPATDVAKAKELVNQAKSEGFNGSVKVVATQASSDEIMTMKAQLEAVGLAVEPELIRNPADLTSRVFVERNFDLAKISLGATEENPYARLSSSLYSKAASNVGAINSPALDAAIDKLRETPFEQQGPALKEIEKVYNADAPQLTLGGATLFVATQPDVQGVNRTNESMLSFEKAWLNR